MDAWNWICRIDLFACVINLNCPCVMLCTSGVSAAKMDWKEEKVDLYLLTAVAGVSRYYSFLLGTDAGTDESTEL